MGFFSETQVLIERPSGFNLNPCQHYAEMFRTAMAEAGIITKDPIIPDGVLRRIHIEGHSRGTRNGSYFLHVDAPVNGWFQDFTTHFKSKWLPRGVRYHPTKADLAAIEAEMALRRAERELQHQEAAISAQEVYGKAVQAHHHPYLEEKRIPACYGLRVTSSGELLVPAFDLDGRLWSLQRIFKGRDGRFLKLFLKGSKTSGMSFRIAGDETIGICEGIATGISLRRETGYSIYVAFGAGNLMAVAKGLRKKHPASRIIIYADNDHKTEGNPGVTKGKEAAKAIFGDLSVPPICGDWNDFLDSGSRQ